MLTKLTIAQYLKRPDAYPMSVATIRRYIEAGVLQGEKIKAGKTYTYFVHIEEIDQEHLLKEMIGS